ADTLQAFYDSVKFRAAGIDNAAGKQKIVVELYDKFFRNAFPKMSERLGIVYTPVEVVDFIIHSVNHLLQTEFNQTLGSKGVHILDPFTGTGTFITRLLQSGLITPEELPYKYRNEIHANEIVLLAYYIAAINIEATYHGILQGNYQPFEGICLTDTFQLHEKEDLGDAMLVKNNNNRRKRQKQLDIRVIMGNPPYSAGQGSANDNNQNIAYPGLDDRIRLTYADRSTATNKNALYDSYIRAIRWASDRIGDSGVVGFVTNAGYLDSNSADGLRKCLAEEFSSLYVFHLRGNQRTSGELSKKEGGKIFGSGSRAPIAISLLVKNPANEQQGQIYFHDIGDYLTREEKLARIVDFGSIDGISQANAWQSITPDQHGDWLNQRDDSFQQFIVLGDKSGTESLTLFENYSAGLKTQRDAWCYNPSRQAVETNMRRMIDFYNAEVDRFNKTHPDLDRSGREAKVDGFINSDPTKISWTRALKQDLVKGKQHPYDKDASIRSLYRPFTKQWLYYNRRFNEMVYQMPRIFPDAGAENLVICVSGIGARSGFSAFISNSLPDIQLLENGQCYPMYLYDEVPRADRDESRSTGDLFGTASPVKAERSKRYALTDEGLEHFRKAYPGIEMSKEDVFYYVYGLLHAPWYREKYADNLAKELPRIPCVPGVDRFRAFCQAGHDLANLHLNYESIKPYPLTLTVHGDPKLTDADYQVEKMRYGKNGKEKDLTTIHYNERITVSGIPLEAYEYIVNGKPALDWVVERQCAKTDKDSGIMSDANDWALETMNNPKYPLELVGKVVAVALGTWKIVNKLTSMRET
ncbi:type ISP restriction/modification enzyme, partial [Ferrovum sp.]|uniref:type ISP restriction/modification enzyme n=1 Tax=Ferrovum sp. TaxID=2609467 RepID=UPI00262C8866